MLTLTIPGKQNWDPVKQEFLYTAPVELKLEHSLLSLAKWESKWHIPFLSNAGAMTREQGLDYLRCMTVSKGVPPEVYTRLTREQCDALNAYMNDPATATWFRGERKPNEPPPADTRPRRRTGSGTETTAEVIYSQMFQLGIPKECEKWHLNRLLTLIRVCQESQNPPKKMRSREWAAERKALNEKRKAKMHTRG